MHDHLDFKFELKGSDDGEGLIEGYASVFDIRDDGGDIIERGAFAKTLKEQGGRIKMLADHDSTKRPGVWTELREDDVGLYVKGRLLLEKQIGRESYIDVKSGALDGLSIGYKALRHSMDGRRRARVLKEIALREISLVTFPMNGESRITRVKSAFDIKSSADLAQFIEANIPMISQVIAEKGWKAAIHEFESLMLREGAGFSHAAAKSIALGGFKAKPEPRDEGGVSDAIRDAFKDLANLIRT